MWCFEDVVFDNTSSLPYPILRYYLIWGHRTIIIKHHILTHHIPELPNVNVKQSCIFVVHFLCSSFFSGRAPVPSTDTSATSLNLTWGSAHLQYAPVERQAGTPRRELSPRSVSKVKGAEHVPRTGAEICKKSQPA